MTTGVYSWHCPLLEKEIGIGLCTDINFERIGFINVGALDDVTKLTGKREPEITRTCQGCPHMPLLKEVGSDGKSEFT
jgi:hypothetical protein